MAKAPTKSTKCEKCGTEWTMKRTLVYGARAETRKQSTALPDLSGERPHEAAHFSRLCAWKVPEY